MDTPHVSPQSLMCAESGPGHEVDVCLEDCDSDQDSSLASPEPAQTQTVTSGTHATSAGARHNHVGSVMLAGVPIVSLFMDGKERLCLAQISNTLLKHFSYNEIHNRRVALGITCVQCTPVQLEILRRAGAMPISSRRCGMITKREAERLVTSFLEHTRPPKLPENFAFDVLHECGWGCKGNFMPSRYNSSRAKCIKCSYCNAFFSPNKFIFHFHRLADSKYTHPDAANFNSWRRHLKLSEHQSSEDYEHAWEDVKAMFNGGSRKRLCTPSSKLRMSDPHAAKQQRLRMEASPLPPAAAAAVMGLSYPYPMLPLPGTACPTLPNVLPRTAHPAFPFITTQDHQHMASPESNKPTSIADYWKTKSPTNYYNPLSMFWSKNMGLGHENHSLPFKNPILDMSKEHAHREGTVSHYQQRAHIKEVKHNAIQENRASIMPAHTTNFQNNNNSSQRERDNKYLSAFKPVLKDTEKPVFPTLHPEKNTPPSPERTPIQEQEERLEGVKNTEAEPEDSNVLDVEGFAETSADEAPSLEAAVVDETLENAYSENDRIPPTIDLPFHEEILDNDRQANCRRSPEKQDKEEQKTAVEDMSVQVSASTRAVAFGSIYSMSKEELQEELVRVMSARKEAEKEYQSIQDSFQEKVQKELVFREQMTQQMQLVKDTLCHEIDQERKARQAVQQRLKDANDALHHFSCKMLALRNCMDCSGANKYTVMPE